MDDYIFFIALMATFCSLAVAIILFLHFLRLEKGCNRRPVEGIRWNRSNTGVWPAHIRPLSSYLIKIISS